MAEGGKSPLTLTLSTLPRVIYTEDSIPLRITFENVETDKITILRHFEPLPVFFETNMVREDGTPVSIPGAGKIDFYQGSMEYITLKKNEIFGFVVDLAKVIPSSEKLKEGNYTISMTYHNQYGNDCFQGIISSNSINLRIETVG